MNPSKAVSLEAAADGVEGNDCCVPRGGVAEALGNQPPSMPSYRYDKREAGQ